MSGCIDALSARHVLAALGPDSVAVIPPSHGDHRRAAAALRHAHPGVPALARVLRGSGLGLRRALDARGRTGTHVVVLAGDGGTCDIGFQCLSSAAERNENILYFASTTRAT